MAGAQGVPGPCLPAGYAATGGPAVPTPACGLEARLPLVPEETAPEWTSDRCWKEKSPREGVGKASVSVQFDGSFHVIKIKAKHAYDRERMEIQKSQKGMNTTG